MDRNCDKCIHHTSGMCDSWDCKMQTVEAVNKESRKIAIEEFAEEILKNSQTSNRRPFNNDYTVLIHKSVIDEIAMELKGE